MAGTTPRGTATRARIVDSAARLMHERGVAATSIDDVLADSRTGKSQLYHYFDDRAVLVAAVVATQVERTVAAHAALLADVDTLAGLSGWVDAIVAVQDERAGVGGCPVGSLTGQLAESRDVERWRLAAGFVAWQQVLAAAVRRIVAEGNVRSDVDADEVAATLLTTLQGGLLMAQATRRTEHLRTALHHVVDSLRPAR